MEVPIKVFKAFGRLLKEINKSSLAKEQVRDLVVQHSEVDDILFMVDIFFDLMSEYEDTACDETENMDNK